MGIDLHAHTTASDGSLSPRELVELAAKRGLSAVAVTDHDTIAGWDEAFAAGREFGVEVVPGIELSTSYPGGRFHLLGYYVAPDSELIAELSAIQEARRDRNALILGNLRRLGVPLEEAEVRAYASDGGQLGRPHFARAMVARGYVASVQEAFDRFLADDGPAYASKQVLTPEEAVRLIREAGGVSVWAHPPRAVSARHPVTLTQLKDVLERDWLRYGLNGIEVWYSGYSPEEHAWAARLAREHGLLAAGGSDFHGASKPTVELGVTNTGGALADEVLDQLKGLRGK